MNLGTYSNTLPEMVTNSRQIWKPKSQALVRKIINYLDNNLENSEYKLYSQRIYTGKLPHQDFMIMLEVLHIQCLIINE